MVCNFVSRGAQFSRLAQGKPWVPQRPDGHRPTAGWVRLGADYMWVKVSPMGLFWAWQPMQPLL